MSFTLNYLTDTYPFKYVVNDFLVKWMSGETSFTVQTSGSTGPPKNIVLTRKQLIASANRTNNFFKLTNESTVLMVLSPHTIAGKMMLVRALIGDYSLVLDEPKLNPLENVNEDSKFSFASLVPAQVSHLIHSVPKRLSQLETILLGGSPIHDTLELQLQQLHPNCYVGFGMTETVSHIALRRLGEPNYTALNGVTFSDSNNQLVIDDMELGIHDLITTDTIELIDDKRFKWLGRNDFAINSGGIKLYPEQIEQVISDLITGTFIIAGIPDVTFGEKCILIADFDCGSIDLVKIQTRCTERLGKYAQPKSIVYTHIVVEAGKKINRKELLATLQGE